MQCKRCMKVMSPGTTYEKKEGGNSRSRRYYECRKCYDRVYVNSTNFQEYLYKELKKK